MISECCGAPVVGEVMGEGKNAIGICSECGDWMGCYNENEERESS